MKKKEVFKKSIFSTLRSIVVSVLFTAVMIALVVHGLNQASSASDAEGLRVLQDGLMRAAVKCYAVEGHYPDNLSYIEDHYGVHVDRSKYMVHYDIFASNLLPDITVLEIKL